MIDAAGSTDPLLAPDKAEAAFKAWLRRLVTGTAELEAFDAGEIDAVMDRDSGCALLLPEAQSALHGSSRIALSALDALPGEVCVLDAMGVVMMANKAWRVSGARACARWPRCAGGRKLLRCLPRRTRKRTRTRGCRGRGTAQGAYRQASVVALPICLPLTPRAQ